MPTEARTILITGVTRGCGRAMVDGMIAAGHTLIGCGRNQAAIDGIRQTYLKPHRFDAVNVANDSEVARWAESILSTGLVPDLLINNAALMNRTAPLWQVPADEFQRLVDVNIVGTANVIRHFAPAMIKRGRGVIVNFSSGWGRSTAPEVAPYCATKFAIEGLSKALAQELPRGMASIALNPGIINTDMLQLCWSDGANAYPSADEWGTAAVPYLLSLSGKDNGSSPSVPW